MPDASSGSVNVELDGTHLRVDARPARLVSLLRGAGGDPVLTAQRSGGDTHTEAVPAAARQVTFQVQDELSVEANRTSDFVALAEESGRRVVVAFNGEVTVLPNGSGGDRFALGAHEALLMPAGGGEPKVVPVDDLSDDDQDQISAVMEAAAMAVVAPTVSGATTDEPATDEPTTDEPAAEPTDATTVDEGEPTQAMPVVTHIPDTPTKPEAPVTKAGSTPAKAGNAQKRNNKKGKKGRPQPQKRPAPLVPAAAAGAAAGAAASGVTKKSVPTAAAKKATTTPAKKAGAVKAGGGGGNRNDDSYEDTPGDRRFIAGAVVLALLVVVVLGVFVLTGDDDDKDSTLATDSSTTSTTSADQTTSTSNASTTSTTAKATTSTAAAAVTTVAPTTSSTTAKATTTSTTAAPTTTAAAPAVKYGIEPKSCVQNANNSITYTATITNQSTAAFDYTIGVVFKDAGGASVAKSEAKVDNLAAGKSVDFTATGTPPRNLANTGNCTVERVDASAS